MLEVKEQQVQQWKRRVDAQLLVKHKDRYCSENEASTSFIIEEIN